MMDLVWRDEINASLMVVQEVRSINPAEREKFAARLKSDESRGVGG
jgi:hypothetical protein